ncbi:MAG: hypothetical protein A3H98_02940 [Bacteroidetes bacterium RIFCSPLOWO2_02_FULL_36_8]|nr:MAG: hypothetical protein A3H98_02940 [Bacteroidetes bacterium RIFCSPLOWO2_02_FULL_36_8]
MTNSKNHISFLNLYLKCKLIFFVITSCLVVPINAQNISDSVLYGKDTNLVKKPIYNNDDSLSTFSNEMTNISDTTLNENDSLKNDTLDARKDIKTTVFYQCNDSMYLDLDSRKMYMYMNADVKYDNMTLKADFIEVDWNTSIMRSKGHKNEKGDTTGKPVFTENKDTYTSDKIGYNFKTRQGAISNVITQYGESYVHGSLVNKNEKNELYIGATRYTTCDRAKPHFYIYSRKSKLIPNEKIVTGPFYLAVADVPTPLGFLFGVFPSRKGKSSGILLPTYGETNQFGFFLENGGYYFAINDYMDLAVRGSVYTKGAWGTIMESKYKKMYKRDGNLKFTYNRRPTGVEGTKEFTREVDYFLNWSHRKVPKRQENFQANVNFGSTSNFRNSLTPDENRFTNSISSNIYYSQPLYGTPLNMNLGMRHSQNNSTKAVSFTFPELAVNSERLSPFKRKIQIGKLRWYEMIYVNYSFNARNDLTAHEDSLQLFNRLGFEKLAPGEKRSQLQNKMRNGAQQVVRASTQFRALKYFTVSPEMNYTEKWSLVSRNIYRNDTGGISIDTVKGFARYGVYSASAAASTVIYGTLNFRSKSLQAIRHTLRPSVSFRYVPDFSEATYGYYEHFDNKLYSRFSNFLYGEPSKGIQEAIGFSISNALEMKVRSRKDTSQKSRKVSLFENVGISGNYNLAADSFNLSRINLSARTTLFENKIGIEYSSMYDPYITDDNDLNVHRFEWEENKRLARLHSANITLRTSLNSILGQKTPLSVIKTSVNSMDFTEGYLPFSLPWSLSVNYQRSYTFSRKKENKTNQSLSFNGSLKLSEKWAFTGSSGYDFTNNDLISTNIGINRDLHCWELKFNWIPYGLYQRYSVTINVKSALLKDLKLERKREWYDQ